MQIPECNTNRLLCIVTRVITLPVKKHDMVDLSQSLHIIITKVSSYSRYIHRVRLRPVSSSKYHEYVLRFSFRNKNHFRSGCKICLQPSFHGLLVCTLRMYVQKQCDVPSNIYTNFEIGNTTLTINSMAK